ncbi:MAG TPA: hypothetical protein PKE65_06925 [Rhizobiaceae bacterium]|nr:hypothetical protein [Rhizobiaceae bacterium]
MAQVTGGACVSEHAVYAVNGQDGRPVGKLRFSVDPEPRAWSDLLVIVADTENGRSWTFHLTASNGYSLNYLLPQDEAAFSESLRIFFFRKDAHGALKTVAIPQSGEPAPDALFTPTLGLELWYATNVDANRTHFPAEIWYRTACDEG